MRMHRQHPKLAILSIIQCGMERGVVLLAVAVSLTVLHGSVKVYLNLPQTNWKWEFVGVAMKEPSFSRQKFMSNNDMDMNTNKIIAVELLVDTILNIMDS